MLFCHYYITSKYISITIFFKKKKTHYLLYQNFFSKNVANWFVFCKFFEEFLYEVGLKKYTIKHNLKKC